jgi:single-strand DNA-binding protein
MSFNKITIVGYLGRDPELRYTPQGTAVCKMSVATTERRRGSSGETEEHTTWFRITVWGRQAELANEYLGKGRQVYVEGRLRMEEYTDREGNQRLSLEVNATDLQFLGQRGDTVGQQIDSVEKRVEQVEVEAEPVKPVAKTPAKPAGAKRAVERQLVSIDEDEIPF